MRQGVPWRFRNLRGLRFSTTVPCLGFRVLLHLLYNYQIKLHKPKWLGPQSPGCFIAGEWFCHLFFAWGCARSLNPKFSMFWVAVKQLNRFL